jgi:hypothetical protein
MKRKLFLTLLALTATFCLAFGISACEQSKTNSNEVNDSGYTDTSDTADNKNNATDKSNQSGESIEEYDAKATTHGIDYELSEDGTYYIVKGISGDTVLTDIIIPNKYNNLPVKEISPFAFRYNYDLKSVKLPKSITSIDFMAFYDCEDLTSITIQNGVTNIGIDAFTDCDKAFNVYDNGYYLGNESNPYYAFIKAKNKQITSCVINPKTEVIASYAFSGCINLTSISIPESLTYVSLGAFWNCENLQFTNYENGYYLGNDSNPYLVLAKTEKDLTSCKINENTKIIVGSALSPCLELKSITIPKSVKMICNGAFSQCSIIENVYYTGTASDWVNIIIESDNEYLTKDKIYYYSETQPTGDGNYWHYDPDGVTPVAW